MADKYHEDLLAETLKRGDELEQCLSELQIELSSSQAEISALKNNKSIHIETNGKIKSFDTLVKVIEDRINVETEAKYNTQMDELKQTVASLSQLNGDLYETGEYLKKENAELMKFIQENMTESEPEPVSVMKNQFYNQKQNQSRNSYDQQNQYAQQNQQNQQNQYSQQNQYHTMPYKDEPQFIPIAPSAPFAPATPYYEKYDQQIDQQIDHQIDHQKAQQELLKNKQINNQQYIQNDQDNKVTQMQQALYPLYQQKYRRQAPQPSSQYYPQIPEFKNGQHK